MYNPSLYLSDQLFRLFSKSMILALYSIDPDVLYHLAIIRIAEIERSEKIPVTRQSSEKDIMETINFIVGETYVTNKELDEFFRTLKLMILKNIKMLH